MKDNNFHAILSFKSTAQAIVTIHLKTLEVTNLLWNGDQCNTTLDYCPKLLEFCVKAFPPLPSSFSECLYHKYTKATSSSNLSFEETQTDIAQEITLKIRSYTVSNSNLHIKSQ